MHIEVNPNQFLEFQFIPDQISTTVFRVKNLYPGGLCFKIKTTAPKCYVVKPCLGFLENGESREITVTMNPKGELQDHQKHKFLIQTCPTSLSSPTADQMSNFWATSPKAIQDFKLSVRLVEESLFKSSSVYNSVISDRSEGMKVEIKELKDFQEKQEITKRKLEDEYDGIMEQLKNRDEEITKIEDETIKGFSSLHLVLACMLGILVGYLYAIIKS